MRSEIVKLKFVDQPYQTDAVNAICDIFDGCEVKDSLFTIEVDNHNKLNFDTEGVDYFIGHSNKLSIDDFTMLDPLCKALHNASYVK